MSELGRTPERLPPPPRVGDEYVVGLIRHAPSRRAATLVRRLYDQHGTPLAIYLGLDGVDAYAPTLEDEFLASWRGQHLSWRDVVDSEITGMGWDDDLQTFLQEHAELEGFVDFDRQALWDFLQDHYEIVDIGGVLYVFNR